MAVILTVVAVTADLFSRLGLFSISEARHKDITALTEHIKSAREEEKPKEEETEQREEEEEEEEEEVAEKDLLCPHFLNTTEQVKSLPISFAAHHRPRL
jgi:beta-phosphoglucomutase-like phosphatase (HAD superfamily)